MTDAQTLLVPPQTERAGGRIIPARMPSAIATGLGAVLLFAAAMKAYTPVPETPQAGWLSHPAVILAAIELEIVLGVWLWSGIQRSFAWWAAVGCFVLFAAVSAYKGFAGAASCGCFGRLHTNPWYTAIFDVAAVLALLWFRPPPARQTASRRRLLLIAAIACVCAAAGAWTMLSRVPLALADETELEMGGTGSLVFLEPQQWIGKRLPLWRYIQADVRWQRGTWLLVLYDADCSVCRKAVPRFAEMAQAKQVNVALIEILPHQSEAAELSGLCPSCVSGSLSDEKDWFATTPVVLLTEDSIVRAVAQGEEALKIHFDTQANKLAGFPSPSAGSNGGQQRS